MLDLSTIPKDFKLTVSVDSKSLLILGIVITLAIAIGAAVGTAVGKSV